MGKVSEDILNGLLCECCGVWMEDVEEQILDNTTETVELFENPPGYPRRCKSCTEYLGELNSKKE